MDAFAAMLKEHSEAGEFSGEGAQETMQIPASGQSTETLEIPLRRFKAAWQEKQAEEPVLPSSKKQKLLGHLAPVAEEPVLPSSKKQKLLGILSTAPTTPKLSPKAKWIPHVEASSGSASSGADSTLEANALDWTDPIVLATESQVAYDLQVPWQERGPPGPNDGGPMLWRNQKYREQSGKWSTRGGKHKDYWNEVHRRMNLTGEQMSVVKAQVLSEKALGGKSSNSKSK
jgi:hypothetical protein